ncbi:hypothetical protein RUND412_005208 [Rhizina undulata]
MSCKPADDHLKGQSIKARYLKRKELCVSPQDMEKWFVKGSKQNNPASEQEVGKELASLASELSKLSKLVTFAVATLDVDKLKDLEREIKHGRDVHEMAIFVEGYLKGVGVMFCGLRV